MVAAGTAPTPSAYIKKPRAFWKSIEIGLVFLFLILHLYVVLTPAASLMHWFTNDDAFYYFKVAANFTNGHGMTFDGINRTNGFQPLWELVCIAIFWLAKYDLVLPLRVLAFVSAMFNAGAAIFLLRLLRRFISAGAAIITTIVWLFLPFIHTAVVQNGLESSLSAFCLTLLIYLAVDWQEMNPSPWPLAGLGIVAGLTILARLDNIFVVLLLGAWFALGTTSAYLRTIIVGDLACIFIVGLLSYFVGFRAGLSSLSSSASLPWEVGLGFVIQPVLFFLFGMYTVKRAPLSWKFVGRISLASALATLTTATILFILHRLGVSAAPPLFVLLLDLCGTWSFALALRLLAGWLLTSEGIDTSHPITSRKFWETPFKRSLGYFVPSLSLLGSFMLWSLLYTGTPMPVSGQVKSWWGTIYISLYGSVKNRDLSTLFGNSAWALALSPSRFITGLLQAHFAIAFLPALVKGLGACLLLAILFSQGRQVIGLFERLGLFALLTGLYAQIFSYTSTSYWDIKNWYWTCEIIFTVIGLGILVDFTGRVLHKLKVHPKLWQASLAVLSAGLIASFGNMLWHEFPPHQPPQNQQAYLEYERVLEANTEPGTLIGMRGGGEIGYFIQKRSVVNLDGLISSREYFQSLKEGTGSLFLDRLGLNYAIATDQMLNFFPYSKLLSGHLIPIKSFGDDTLYRYVPSE